MLLYTRVATPKVPKRRSRAGCTFCKEKKKKCNERRPQCARCAEKGLVCTYEAVKARQRRKRDSLSGFAENLEALGQSRREFDDWPECDSVVDIYDGERINGIDSIDDATDNVSPTMAGMVLSPRSPGFFENLSEDGESQSTDLVRSDSNLSVGSDPYCAARDWALTKSPTLEFIIPVFSEFSDRPSRRGLVDHFCSVLSHLIVFREESGNPFQQLVLPLSHESSPVMNAIYALASAHLEYRGANTGEKSLYFHNEALNGLAQLIEDGKNNNRKNELLAAIMLLVYYEVLVQSGRSNIVDGHLKGALTIMNSFQGDPSPTSIFLERAFRFYDVITALSLGTAPLHTTPGAGCMIPFGPLNSLPASPLSNVDSLLGMATTLWPIMHRLSNLLSLKGELEKAVEYGQSSKIAVLRTEYETTSRAIEVALQQWQPKLPPNLVMKDNALQEAESLEVPSERILLQSILHNALAYRHSASVYLYRTIYGYAPGHELVQKHAHASLVHCVKTVASEGPMGALLWPLFVAACEAISTEDRALAKQAFVEVEIHQGMVNIEKAWAVVQEVWKQVDLLCVTPHNSEDTEIWRRVSKEMGVSIVFG